MPRFPLRALVTVSALALIPATTATFAAVDNSTMVKALPIRHAGPRPMDEAISTAGGVRFDALDDALMLPRHPCVFVAGEMLDWEATTGGYLITGCLATGRWAGLGAARWVAGQRAIPPPDSDHDHSPM